MGTSRDWDEWLDFWWDDDDNLLADAEYAEFMREQEEAEAARREETPIYYSLCEWHMWTPVPE